MEARDRTATWGERGVSQVVGVVMLVGITVVLAGAVTALVFGFGGTQPSQAPSFADDTGFDDRLSGNGQYLNVSHDGGSELDADEVHLAVDGAKIVDASGSVVGDAHLESNVFASQVGSGFVASDTLVVDKRAFDDAGGNDLTAGEFVDLSDATVRLVYYPGGNQDSAVIYECDVAYPDCENK